MLEQRIEELTAAVKALTEAFTIAKEQGAAKAVQGPETANATGEQTDFSSEKFNADGTVRSTPRSAKEAKPAKVEPVAEEAPNVSPTSEPSEPESAPVTYDDVKKATNALSAAKGRDVTIATLAMFNVQKATQLLEAQWAEYVAYATKVASDE
jgi:hypothetical protein